MRLRIGSTENKIRKEKYLREEKVKRTLDCFGWTASTTTYGELPCTLAHENISAAATEDASGITDEHQQSVSSMTVECKSVVNVVNRHK